MGHHRKPAPKISSTQPYAFSDEELTFFFVDISKKKTRF